MARVVVTAPLADGGAWTAVDALARDARRAGRPKATAASLGVVLDTWPPSTDALCLHCCEPIVGPPLPAVRSFDAARRAYSVMGNFCSGGCAMGWQHEHGESPQLIAYTRVLLRDAFAHRVLAVAPPRCTLDKFGGPLTLREFRGADTRVVPQLVMPPLITYAMVVSAQAASGTPAPRRARAVDGTFENADRTQVRGLRRPRVRTTPEIARVSTGREPLLLRVIAERGGAPRDDADAPEVRSVPPKRVDAPAAKRRTSTASSEPKRVRRTAASGSARAPPPPPQPPPPPPPPTTLSKKRVRTAAPTPAHVPPDAKGIMRFVKVRTD